MKRYMVVYSIPATTYTWEGKTMVDPASSGSSFFDSMSDAADYAQDCNCGLGGHAQVYEWKEATVENDFDGGYYEFIFD